MKGAIFFATKYGSTKQYANWIAEATGLPVFEMKETKADPSDFDFLLLGGPIIYYKLYGHEWIKANWSKMETKPILLFSVSGAPAGPKLDKWFANCLPDHMIAKMKHFALRGRQNPKELTWYDWIMLKIGGMMNKDPQARKEEMQGFDYMDKSSIKSIVKMVMELQSEEVLS